MDSSLHKEQCDSSSQVLALIFLTGGEAKISGNRFFHRSILERLDSWFERSYRNVGHAETEGGFLFVESLEQVLYVRLET